MASKVQLLRRINGAAGSPAAAGFAEGELALNFPGAAGTTAKPELWAHDGSGWRQVNPDVTIATQSVDLNTPGGADVGAAAAAWIAANAPFTGNVVIGTFGVPAQAYVLTNSAAPGAAASWTSLGGAVSFATAAEIAAGTDTVKAINSAILRGETLNVPSGAGGVASAADADKLIRLDANGLIDDGFISFKAVTYRGNLDVTAAYAAPGTAWAAGDFATVSATGTPDATWAAVGVPASNDLTAGDLLIWDGAAFHVVPQEVDLSAYLALAGGTMAAGDGTKVTFAPTTTDGTIVVLDLGSGKLDNAYIDAGTY